MYDIIIIGAGPAGLTAAIYARRAQKTVLIIEKSTFGGQITYSPKIENYPGYKQISGAELADLMVEQALSLGAEIELDTACNIENENGKKAVICDGGTKYYAKAVIIAAGVKHRMLGIDGENELVGNGISFCAVCDGAFCRGETVAVVGGGNSALQEAILLSDICERVIIIQNLDYFTGEEALLEVLRKKSNVDYILSTVICGFEKANGRLSSLRIMSEKTKEVSSLKVDSLFIAIGLVPDNGPYEKAVSLTENGYISTTDSCMTDCTGIFAAGDCRDKEIRQITTAAGDGAIAALAACKYIDENEL